MPDHGDPRDGGPTRHRLTPRDLWPWDRRRDFTGFTGTWWGMGLLYGGPAALVLWEILPRLRRRGKKTVRP